jgi:hypothetical protein
VAKTLCILLVAIVSSITYANSASSEQRMLPFLLYRIDAQNREVLAGSGSGVQARFEPDGVKIHARGHVLRLRFASATAEATLIGTDSPGGQITRFGSSSGEIMAEHFPLLNQIIYRGVAPGVSAIFSGSQGLKSEFQVPAGADPASIRFQYENAEVALDIRGDLVVTTPHYELRERAPHSYQVRNGIRQIVESRFHLFQNGTIGFQLGDYDENLPLIIDPSITFSTFIGGSTTDSITAVTTGADGSIYMAGTTDSSDLLTRFAVQPSGLGSQDAFVFKLAPDKTIVYATYIGGSSLDRATAIAVDGSGMAYVAGATRSRNFPLLQAPVGNRLGGYQNGFICAINPSGATLRFSRYFGGSGVDSINALQVDTSGNVYVVGSTNSPDFPATAPLPAIRGPNDAFVAKFGPLALNTLYSTVFGGGGSDEALALALRNGEVYVTGDTDSTDFPVLNAYQATSRGGQQAFVAKFGSAGTFIYSTYLGGFQAPGLSQMGSAIAVDSLGQVFVAGLTGSATFPTRNAYQGALRGVSDGFIAKVSPPGTTLPASTYLGGSSFDTISALALDKEGNVCAVGQTSSWDYPMTNAVQPALAGLYDATITCFDQNLSAPWFSTYWGGSGSEIGYTAAFDAAGSLVVAGQTNSFDFRQVNPAQPVNGSSLNGWLTQFDISDVRPIMSLPTVAIDSPIWGTQLSGSVTVSGWTLDSSTVIGTQIQNVDIQIDGVRAGSAFYGAYRGDVCGVFPGRPGCDNVGYTYTLNTYALSNGPHTLRVVATDSDYIPHQGSAQIAISIFNQPGIPPRIAIDTPLAGSTLSGTIDVSGWVLDVSDPRPTAISTVDVYIDSTKMGSAFYGTPRADVCSVYPGRPGCNNVGYTYQLDTRRVISGAHQLRIVATDSDPLPSQGTVQIPITVQNFPPIVAIDVPGVQYSTVSGTLGLLGWTVDGTVAGATLIRSVDIYIDGVRTGSATYGDQRPDVCAVFPRPGCNNVGYHANIDTRLLSNGPHVIQVVATNSASVPSQGLGTMRVTVAN